MIEPLSPFSADIKTPTPGEKRRMEERRKQRRIEKAHKRLLEEMFANELADNRRRREGGK
ncbi:hypothetical protein [Corynebacterium casei]|uniref:hypothetical protein n=1 Tax=Corynebacterium casei TaxID=160386 RepID=UPI003FD0AC05